MIYILCPLTNLSTWKVEVMKVELVEKISKNGNKYVVLEIALTPTYKKVVFLDNAELELVKLYVNK
jgi:hypothetical protein